MHQQTLYLGYAVRQSRCPSLWLQAISRLVGIEAIGPCIELKIRPINENLTYSQHTISNAQAYIKSSTSKLGPSTLPASLSTNICDFSWKIGTKDCNTFILNAEFNDFRSGFHCQPSSIRRVLWIFVQAMNCFCYRFALNFSRFNFRRIDWGSLTYISW